MSNFDVAFRNIRIIFFSNFSVFLERLDKEQRDWALKIIKNTDFHAKKHRNRTLTQVSGKCRSSVIWNATRFLAFSKFYSKNDIGRRVKEKKVAVFPLFSETWATRVFEIWMNSILMNTKVERFRDFLEKLKIEEEIWLNDRERILLWNFQFLKLMWSSSWKRKIDEKLIFYHFEIKEVTID